MKKASIIKIRNKYLKTKTGKVFLENLYLV